MANDQIKEAQDRAKQIVASMGGRFAQDQFEPTPTPPLKDKPPLVTGGKSGK